MNDVNIEIKDLKPGDVLLFSGVEGDFVSEAIMLLTDSKVSHAAMSYRESDKIIEESPPAVGIAESAKKFKGRDIYVNRFNGSQDLLPVMDASEKYLNDKAPYAFSNLILVGLILLYRRVTPHDLEQAIMIEIFKKLASEIITEINRHEHPGKTPMVCSQFVYQSYNDAGAPYHLKIRTDAERLLANELEALSLLDQMMVQTRTNHESDFTEFLASSAVAEISGVTAKSADELAKELRDVLAAPAPKAAAAPSGISNELLGAAYQFAEAFYTMRTGGTQADLSALSLANDKWLSPDAFNFLKSEEAYFVTPEDLLSRCTNTTRVGVIRGKAAG